MIRPPITPPNWFRLSVSRATAKKSRAFRSPLRKNSNRSPWNSFVPDLVVDNQRVSEMPLNGRNPIELVFLAGMSSSPGNGAIQQIGSDGKIGDDESSIGARGSSSHRSRTSLGCLDFRAWNDEPAL